MDYSQVKEDVMMTSYREGDIVIVNGLKELEHKISLENDLTTLLMCQNGKIQLHINGREINMEKSDLLFILPNSTLSDMMFSANAECSGICVSSMHVQNFLRTQDLLNILLSIRQYPLFHVSSEKIENLIAFKGYVKQRLSTTHPYYEKIMSHFMEIILYDIFGSYKEAMEEVITTEANYPNRSNQLFSSFVALLHEDRGIHREVCYYADKLFISPKYLSALCKEASGKTCSKWISEMVLDEIQQQLRYTDLSIKEIADRLAFPNPSFFCKYVRKFLGCSPAEYRQKFRVNNGHEEQESSPLPR